MRIMRPTWKSIKWLFRLLLAIVFITKITSINASVLRHKRVANSLSSTTVSSLLTQAPKATTEIIFDGIDIGDIDLLTGTNPPAEIAIDGDIDDETLPLDSNRPTINVEHAMPQQLKVLDSKETVRNAHATAITTALNDVLADIKPSSSASTLLTLLPNDYPLTTSSQKPNEIITSTSVKAILITTTEDEVATTMKDDGISENITTENLIDSNTKIEEIIPETTVNSNWSRSPAEINDETTYASTIESITIGMSEIETSTVPQDQISSNAIKTTTDFHLDSTNIIGIDTTTTIDPAETENEQTRTTELIEMEKGENAPVDKFVYDTTINEIKSNATIDNRQKETVVLGKHTKRPNLEKPIEKPSVTSTIVPSVSISKSPGHVYNQTEFPKTEDAEYITKINNSFTNSGANSIENTLENGLVDNSVGKKSESKQAPQDVEVRQAIKLPSTSAATNEVLSLTTTSIEKNKVEDIQIVPLKPNALSPKIIKQTTEIMSNLFPNTTIAANVNETEALADTTTKRTERSTTIPTTMETRRTLIITTTNFTPLSTIPIERIYETTTPTDDYITSDHGTDTNSLTTDSVLPITSKKALLTSDSGAVETKSNSIKPSTVRIETIPFTATLNPGSTTLQEIEFSQTTEETMLTMKSVFPSSTNATHIVTTEPSEMYDIEERSNRNKESNDMKSSSIFSVATTTEYQTATTEQVTTDEPEKTDYNVIIAISVSVVGIVALILLVGFLYVMRKRQKSISYGQRCRPVSLDAYSLDNVSIFNSVRRKGNLRASKRSYGNAAFDDPTLKHNSMSIHELDRFITRRTAIFEEYKDVPQITARPDEVPPGCEDKNRYANVIPLPETRVLLTRIADDERTEYINANYVRGPKDPQNYYIACQAPLESTVCDFWRMIWEQNSRVIIMATDLVENEVEKCAEYLPPSMTLDNHTIYGNYQITLKNREVKEKYAVSTLHIKNIPLNRWREITHFWYQWPETGVPNDEASVIAMLLEARSYLKMGTPEQSDEETEKKSNDVMTASSSSLDKTKSLTKTQGPLTVHCSPGTGRTGTIISCDMALRSLETPKRIIDIPQIVYYVRRGRASAVQTKEQYEFIYKIAHMYARKISGPVNDN